MSTDGQASALPTFHPATSPAFALMRRETHIGTAPVMDSPSVRRPRADVATDVLDEASVARTMLEGSIGAPKAVRLRRCDSARLDLEPVDQHETALA